MTNRDEDSFKNLNRKEKVATVLGITILLAGVIGLIIGVLFFGFAGIFEVLGVRYDSVWDIVIFVISYFIIGFIVDIFLEAMAKLTVAYVSGKMNSFLIQWLFGFASNWLVLFIVDAMMASITLTLVTKIILALFLGLLDPVFDNKKPE